MFRILCSGNGSSDWLCVNDEPIEFADEEYAAKVARDLNNLTDYPALVSYVATEQAHEWRRGDVLCPMQDGGLDNLPPEFVVKTHIEVNPPNNAADCVEKMTGRRSDEFLVVIGPDSLGNLLACYSYYGYFGLVVLADKKEEKSNEAMA